MSTERTLLLMGTSALYFTETTPEDSFRSLVEGELSARSADIEWRCLSEDLYLGPTMARRTATLLDRHQPDAALVYLSAPQFVYERTHHRVKQRWPSLVKAWKSWSVRMARLGDTSEFQQPASLRGWLFCAPRLLARTLVGGATEMSVEAAAACTLESLGVLLKHEDLAVICRLPMVISRARGAQARRYQARVDQFDGHVVEYCRRRHIASFDLAASLRAGGQPVVRARDALHLGLPTRRFEAALIAERVLEASQVPVRG